MLTCRRHRRPAILGSAPGWEDGLCHSCRCRRQQRQEIPAGDRDARHNCAGRAGFPARPVRPPPRTADAAAQSSALLLAVVLLAALGLVAAGSTASTAIPGYDAQVITYTEITDSQVVVDFRVTVPAGGSAACVLRARAADGAEVGREEVTVTARPGERQVDARHRLATTARPFIGEVLRCRPAA